MYSLLITASKTFLHSWKHEVAVRAEIKVSRMGADYFTAKDNNYQFAKQLTLTLMAGLRHQD